MPKRSIQILCKNDGTVEVAAYCLSTDSWFDYEAFLVDAEKAMKVGDKRTANRYLRASLHCLFAHVEGVMNLIESEKEIEEVFPKGRLCDRTKNVSIVASKFGPLPYINFRLEKHLRDIISHPGIEKSFFDERIGEAQVFEKLNIKTMRTLGRQIGLWLDAVCKNLDVDRFTDTKSMVEKMSRSLTVSQSDPQEV